MKYWKWMGIIILAIAGLTACGSDAIHNIKSSVGNTLNSVMKPTLPPDESFAKEALIKQFFISLCIISVFFEKDHGHKPSLSAILACFLVFLPL